MRFKKLDTFFTSFTWKTLLVYAVLLGALGGYAWKEYGKYQRQTNLFNNCLEAQSSTKGNTRNMYDNEKYKIQKKEPYLENGDSVKYKNAKKINRIIDSGVSFLENEILIIFRETIAIEPYARFGPGNRPINHADIIDTLLSIRDSLKLWGSDDPLLHSRIDSFINSDRLLDLKKVLKSGRYIEKALVLQMLQIGLNVLGFEVLAQFSSVRL